MARKSRNQIGPIAATGTRGSLLTSAEPKPIERVPSESDIHMDMLARMAEQINRLHEVVVDRSRDADADASDEGIAAELDQVRRENDELREQNEDLATQLANSNLRTSVSSPQSSTSDALSWDQRKQLILRQMESDTFDAETFVQQLQCERDPAAESPVEFVQSLCDKLKNREVEIGELRLLVQQKTTPAENGVAVGAAAIAELIDSDDLVLQERERLQQLQAEWEEKFRRAEIEASLERAKLSRERQQLANKTMQLEEQIEHLRREARQTEEIGGASSRRWMVKLGLSDD